MPLHADTVIRNAYLQDRDAVLDIGIVDGRIAEIADPGRIDGDEEIDAAANLVSPGFVDCHKHVDRAFAAAGERRPSGVDGPFADRPMNELFDEHYENASLAEIEANAVRAIEQAVAAGATHIRSHVGVDHVVGTETMVASLDAKQRTAEIVDLQLVPAAFGGITADGADAAVREAVELGLSAVDDEAEILVGGADPATRNDDVPGTIAAWFDVATDYGIDIDVHVQDNGTLGHHTLDRLVEETRSRGYEGRVTASHCFSLAEASPERLESLLEAFTDVDLKAVTCYNSIRASMPVREIVESGVRLGHGTDNTRDFVIPSGTADTLEGLGVLSQKLLGADRTSQSYRWSETNAGIDLLWDLATHRGASVLGVEDQYGVKEGAVADLVVFDEPSRQWAVIERAERSYVLKRGEVVAEDGEIRPEYSAAA